MEKINANKREKLAAHSAKKERRKGLVPGILYGNKLNNLMFEIGDMELAREISRNGENGILNIKIDGNDYTTLIKEVQREPVTKKIIHIDLEQIPAGKTVQAEVPLLFLGMNELRNKGGILQKEKSKVKVECDPSQIPKNICVDVSSLYIGDKYRISDIEISREITFVEANNTILARVTDENTSKTEIDDEINPPEEIKES